MLDPKLYCDFKAHALYLIQHFGHEGAKSICTKALTYFEKGYHAYSFNVRALEELEALREKV